MLTITKNGYIMCENEYKTNKKGTNTDGEQR